MGLPLYRVDGHVNLEGPKPLLVRGYFLPGYAGQTDS